MKNLFYLCILGIILTIQTAYGQVTPYGLRIEKVQREVIEKTAKFDSLVFVNKASFWNDDRKIKGFGYVDKKVKKVIISFEKDTTSSYDLKIRKVRTAKIRNKVKLDYLKQFDFYRVEKFSNDSLNLKSRTDIITNISDQPTWTILIIKKAEVIIKQSYAPGYYQQRAPTTERKEFIEIVKTLNEKIK